MAVFTNPQDATLSLITQIAQVDATSLSEIRLFVLLYVGQTYDENDYYWELFDDFAPLVIKLIQDILKTVMELEGCITVWQEKELRVLRLEIEQAASADHEEIFDHSEEEQNVLIPAEEISFFNRFNRKHRNYGVISLLLDMLREVARLLRSSLYFNLKICEECKSIYLPKSNHATQVYCSRRCSNRAHNRAHHRRKRQGLLGEL